MKLKNLPNLADLNLKPASKLGTNSQDRISFYFWILLSIPILTIFSSSSLWKWVAVFLPMIHTGWHVPHSFSVASQYTKIKKSAEIHFLIVISFLIIHVVTKGFNFVEVLIQSIVIFICFIIKNINYPTDSETEADSDEEESNDAEVSKEFHKFDSLLNIFTMIMIVIIAGINGFYYQPLVIFSLFIVEYFAKRFNMTVKYGIAIKLVSAAFVLGAVTLRCFTNSDGWSQTALLVSAWIFSLITSSNKLLLRLNRPLNVMDYLFIKRKENMLEILTKSPNLTIIFDRFWSFLFPIPLVIGLWSISFMKSSCIDPPMIGILTTLAASLIIVQIHWIVARMALVKLSSLMIIALLLVFLIYEAPSNDRRILISIQLVLFRICYWADSVYGLIYDLMRSGHHFKTRNTFYISAKYRIYTDAIQRIWAATSPIVSAFLIFVLAMKSLDSEARYFLLVLSALAGIVARSNFQLPWALIEIYIIIEQVFVLFLSQKNFPVVLVDVKLKAIVLNVLILIIAESQRLRAMPSIFSEEKSINQSRIQDSSKGSETVEGESDVKNNLEDEEEEVTPDYDNSLLWWIVTALGRATNVTSLLVLMAVILFYPQFVGVTIQTCLYSLWAFLFTFLFYRSEVTSRLKFAFILILAILSFVFFIYDLQEVQSGKFDTPINLFNEEEDSNILLLHGLVFWFSSGAILAMRLEANENEEKKIEPKEDSVEALNSPNSETSPVKSIEDTTTLVSVKAVNEAGSFLERVFVVYWTRSCALLAFLAASFNPSLFGVIHLIIGCFLAWKNTLNPTLYVPMILWILCATFFPAVISKLSESENINVMIVGELKSSKSTVCLTMWALTLFLQPVFINSLKKLTTETDRKYGLVSFQILPQDDNNILSPRQYESFENSTRYYVSNWFVEFHNEIMVAVLVAVSVSRLNLYGIFNSILAVLHVIVPILSKETALKALATISFTMQMICFILEYCLSLIYSSYSNSNSKSGSKPGYFKYIFDTIVDSEAKQNFFDLGPRNTAIIIKSIFVGMNIILTVRWYLTSSYYEIEKPKRRFDSHWCRLCNQVSFKSMHAYSKAKHNIHLHFGWVSHAFLFMTAISAHDKPTVPSVLLLMFSLVFFFYGESSILMPKIRNQVYAVLGIILSWVLFNSFSSTIALLGVPRVSETIKYVINFSGLTNILMYLDDSSVPLIFSTVKSRVILGITVFLFLLQIRLHRSKAWPFVLARLYHSYATSAKRARLFHQNLQSAINFQQKNLDKAKEHFRKQVASMNTLDISNWKKLCYQPPEEVDGIKSDDKQDVTTALPEYGNSSEHSDLKKEEVTDSASEHEDGTTRHRNVEEIRKHVRNSSTDALIQNKDEEFFEVYHSPESLTANLNFNARDASHDSLAPSDETAKMENKAVEGNFYLYTWLSMLRHIAKYIISSSQDYRRLQSRPTKKASMRILFHHQDKAYRFEFFIQVIFDFINANFDLVLDYFVLDAQLYHSSGFSLFLVLSVLLISRAQRPFTNKILHSRMIIFCAIWIIFNFCKVVVFPHSTKKLISVLDTSVYGFEIQKTSQEYGQGFFYRFLGFHIYGTIQDVTWRPTLILLALSYKRSLMRQLGLWDYGKGIQMARNYYQSEEDLDEIGEINVAENEADPSLEIDVGGSGIFSTDSSDSDNDADENESILTENSEIYMSNRWKELIWPSFTMPWRDMYVYMFISDFICLFLMVYYWGDFSLGFRKGMSNSFLSDMINQNMVPESLVNIVILATFILIVDRALYVSKNRIGKLALQFATLMGYHVFMFFYLTRLYRDPNISLIWGVKLWYFCKWIYWITSAIQLQYNYPPLRTETFLGTEYGIVGANLHTIYRNIPFVDELKTIIDWSVTPSALGIWPWLKISDVFERLYAVQCARAFQGTYYGRHQFGMPFNQFSKIIQGVIFVIVAVLVLWSPFLILSRPWMMTSNTVNSFKLEIGLENNGPPFMTFYQDKFVKSSLSELEKFQYIEGVNPLEFDESFFTKIQLPIASQVPWRVTELARFKALEYLEKDPDGEVNLTVKWTITREKSQSHPVIQGSNMVKLSEKEKKSVKSFLDSSNIGHKTSLSIKNLIPFLIKAPIAGNSKMFSDNEFKRELELVKVCPNLDGRSRSRSSSTDGSVQDDTSVPRGRVDVPSGISSSSHIDGPVQIVTALWHKVSDAVHTGKFTTSAEVIPVEKYVKPLEFDEVHHECQFFLLSSEGGQPEIFIYSNKMPYYNFSSMNFTGLYFTIVLTASQLLKMMHADMTTRIQYDELPNPLPLLIMCQQILMMRELGDFANEESIYWQLIEILRNPQILIEMTKL